MPTIFKEVRKSSFDLEKASDKTKVKITDTRFYGGESNGGWIDNIIGFSYLSFLNFPKTDVPVEILNEEEIKASAYDVERSFEYPLKDGVYKVKFGTVVKKSLLGTPPYFEEVGALGEENGSIYEAFAAYGIDYELVPVPDIKTLFDEKVYVKYSEIYDCYAKKLKDYVCKIKNNEHFSCKSKEFKDFLYLQSAIHYLESICEVGINSNFFGVDYISVNGELTSTISTQEIVVDDSEVSYETDFTVEFDQARWTKDFSSIFDNETSAYKVQTIIDNCKTICCCC